MQDTRGIVFSKQKLLSDASENSSHGIQLTDLNTETKFQKDATKNIDGTTGNRQTDGWNTDKR